VQQHADDLATIKRDARRSLGVVAGIVASFWLVAIVNVAFFSGSLLRFGVRPRTLSGLIGIPVHPFLHLGLTHLLLNSLGFLMLGGLVILREERDFWIATVLGTFVGGLGVWLMGRNMIHVGASGIIFSYFGYLLATGWYDRRFGAIFLSVVVFLAWGTALIGLLPTQSGISWETHLFGFIAGIMTAWLRAHRRKGRAA